MDLIDLEDGLDADAYFQFVRGDGCEVGLNDWETKIPMRWATAWGTNSTTIKEALAHLCSAPEEEHQPIQGSNEYLNRSVQKASWAQETCDRILLALEKGGISSYEPRRLPSRNGDRACDGRGTTRRGDRQA